MQNIYFTVGPSQLNPNFQQYLQKALQQDMGSVSHRGAYFCSMHEELGKNLKKLFNVPEDYHVFYSGSATEWMERIVQNCSQKDTLHLVSGAFSKKFYDFAAALGRNAVKRENLSDFSFNLNDLPDNYNPELICLTHNETSNGLCLPRDFVKQVRQKYPESLIAVDVVSSAPCCDLDFSEIDLFFFSVQKGFGLPAGLGVLMAGPKAVEKSKIVEKSGVYTGQFHSFDSLLKYEAKHQTPETPNVMNLFLLNEATKDFLNAGKEKLIKDMLEKSAILRNVIFKTKEFSLLGQNKTFMSDSILVLQTINGSGEIIKKLKEKGFIVGSGYGENKQTQIRIGNFPSHDIKDVQVLVNLLQDF